jgi:hypothetical protein
MLEMIIVQYDDHATLKSLFNNYAQLILLKVDSFQVQGIHLTTKPRQTAKSTALHVRILDIYIYIYIYIDIYR